ncbi:hypothetical protein PF008_g11057 [Phytophthora fragariae]|uniref:Secreted protein n=1 Tax=Phytophthora fragariae TaxID=53985 RepID=A0A6G0RTD5_9STRA|nr:hypothetical protein PF008_g11057 [Phytophthora fragariae]
MIVPLRFRLLKNLQLLLLEMLLLQSRHHHPLRRLICVSVPNGSGQMNKQNYFVQRVLTRTGYRLGQRPLSVNHGRRCQSGSESRRCDYVTTWCIVCMYMKKLWCLPRTSKHGHRASGRSGEKLCLRNLRRSRLMAPGGWCATVRCEDAKQLLVAGFMQ